MLQQGVLDLRRVDVHPAGDEHVFGAARDIEEPVGVAPRHVAGVEPAVGVACRRGRVGVFPVAGRDVRPAKAKLTHLIGRQLLAALVDHPRLGEHQRPADRACPGPRLFVGHRKAVDPDLGQTVALPHHHATLAVHTDQVARHRRTAGDEPAHVAEVGRLELGRVGEHLPDRRHTEDNGAAFLGDHPPHLGGVEIAVEDDGPTGEHDRHQKGAEPTRVIERGEDRAHVVLRKLPAGDRVVGIPGHHAVRGDDSLRATRRARRVEQAVGILRIADRRHIVGLPHRSVQVRPREIAGVVAVVERHNPSQIH